MRHDVPLARRNLLAEPRRLVASAAGVGLALMLILLLDGLWAGIESRTTVYEDHSGAQLYVAQSGTRNFFSTISSVPMSTVDEVRADPEVTWAAPVRGLFSIMEMHDTKLPVFLIGSQPGNRGGPWDLAKGRAPTADDEVAVGQVLAQRHGVKVGDHIDLLGRSFDVVGIARGADMFMASFVFMTHAATDQVLKAPDTTSFVLVGTDHPEDVRARLATSGLAVLDRNQLRSNDLAVMTRAFSTPIRLMLVVAFAVGCLVIALSAYSAIVDRRREYGIVKALGAGRVRLYRVALTQTSILALIGLAAGGAMFLVGRDVITELRPQFTIVLTLTSVARAVVAALAMGLVAAWLPARRLTRLDPTTAYQGG